MHDLTYAGTILAQSREKLYAAQAPRFIAQRELELLQAAERTPRQPRYSVRRVLALDFAHAQIDQLVSRRMGRHCLARAG